MHPTDWFHAADACEAAGSALNAYAETVEWAQEQARGAVELHRAADKARKDAADTYAKQAEAFNAAVRNGAGDPGPPPVESTVGAAEIKRAREVLTEARRQRDDAATTAERAIAAATQLAPAEPPPGQRAMAEFLDQGGAVAVELNHVVGGAAKGTAGMLNFARGLNPMDFYNLTHPAEYAQSVSTSLAGLVSTAAHPERIPGAFIDSFKDDPSEGLGRLIPELIGTKGLGGARVGARIGQEALEAGTEGAAKHTAHPGSTPHEIPDWKDLAKPTDQVSERAIHADSVTPEEAQNFLDDQYPWLKDINNTHEYGYTQNCSHNVVTVDRRLDGAEVSTSPKIDPDHIPPKELGLKDREPGDYDWVHGYDDIIRDLETAGGNARSVVYIQRADGTGHVFNAVNTDHGVVFLDGQSGTLAKLEDAQYIGHIPYKRK